MPPRRTSTKDSPARLPDEAPLARRSPSERSRPRTCGSGQGGRWRDISGRGYLPSGRPSERASGLLIDRRIGVHTAPSKSVTLAAAAEDWLNFVTLEKREPATIASYRQH